MVIKFDDIKEEGNLRHLLFKGDLMQTIDLNDLFNKCLDTDYFEDQRTSIITQTSKVKMNRKITIQREKRKNLNFMRGKNRSVNFEENINIPNIEPRIVGIDSQGHFTESL